MSVKYDTKRTKLRNAYCTEGKSCKELISDRERLDLIEAELRRGEELLLQAERLRKQGLELKKRAEEERRKELILQEAIRRFVQTDPEFIEENGQGAPVLRLREGDLSGRTFVVITGEASAKQFQVFYLLS